MATARWLLLVGFVLLVALAAGGGLAALLGWPQRPPLPLAARAGGALLAGAGLALGAWTFRHHPAREMARVTARSIEIATRRLDPAESHVPRLLTRGPYRHVRNPTYLSVLLLYVGLGLALPWVALLLASAVLLAWWNLVVIPAEERELEARFGDEYRSYRAATWRFLPRP